MPVAPKEEQAKIVGLVEAVDKKILALNEMLVAQQQLKKALMYDLLTGKVRVNNINITSLLEREL